MEQKSATGKFDAKDALRDALFWGVIAVAIFGSMIGFKVENVGSTTVVIWRLAEAGMAIGIVIVGRFILYTYFWKRRLDEERNREKGPGAVSRFAEKVARLEIYLVPLFIGIALVYPFMSGFSRYWVDIGIVVMTYVMLGWGLNVVVGLAGLLDLGYVAFYAVGAYSYALISTYFDWSFWVCLPLAGILAACWGIILGFPVLRLRGDYLAIVTLAFGEIIRLVLINWYEFTGGPDGIGGIPKPTFFGLEFDRRSENGFADFFGLEYSTVHKVVFFYYLIVVLAFVTAIVTRKLTKLPVGRAWEALREDEIACRALGINTTNSKLAAFAIGAMFGGFAGSFFATRLGHINPESFTFIESAIILAIVVLGGLGSQIGVVIASIVMIGVFQEVFREFSEYRMLIFGMAMVAMMVWKPRGLLSARTPSLQLFKGSRTKMTTSEGAG